MQKLFYKKSSLFAVISTQNKHFFYDLVDDYHSEIKN